MRAQTSKSRLLHLALLAAAIWSCAVAAASQTEVPSRSRSRSHIPSPFLCLGPVDISTTCPVVAVQPSKSSPPHSPPHPPPPREPESQQPKPPPREPESTAPASPWSRSPICRRAGRDEFCAFTHSTFAGGKGISLITTPSRILLLGSQPPLNESTTTTATTNQQQQRQPNPNPNPNPQHPIDNNDENNNLYTESPIPGKGQGLLATRHIRAGQRVMTSTPAVMVDDKAFRGLRRDDLAMLLGLAVVALPGGHSGRFLGLSGGHSSHSFSSSEGEGGEKEEGKETQLDLVHRIFMANAFRTQVVGVGVEEMIIAVREGKEKEGKEAPPVPEGWEKVMDFQSAFVEIARLNHACSPNLGYYFDSATLSHKVYAARDIYPGEELTISYIDILQPSQVRQSLLAKTWSFTCTCQRCTQNPSSSFPHIPSSPNPPPPPSQNPPQNPNKEIQEPEPHLLQESNSRTQQILQLRRDLAENSPSATPQKAELFITLYELEGLQVRIYEAYYRAALEFNGVGDSGTASRYARLCLDKGLALRGPDPPFVASMRELVADPTGHWSWKFRIKNDNGAETSGEQAGKGTEG